MAEPLTNSPADSAPGGQPAAPRSHRHQDAPSRFALAAALACTLAIAIVELIGGMIANSLALQGDAGHMLSDSAALGLALFASWLVQRPLTAQRTFGLRRAEVLAATCNAVLLLAIAAWVGVRAVMRLSEPVAIAADAVIVIAVVGIVVNLIALRLLGQHRHSSLNTRAAFLHVAGDTLGSAGVIVAALVIRFTGWTPADAIVSLVIAALLTFSAARLLRDSVSVLLLATPAGVDAAAVKERLLGVAGVRDIHDLHIWTVSSGFISLSCHADVEPGAPTDAILRGATELLEKRFGIRHVTIQPEVSRAHDESDSCQILAF